MININDSKRSVGVEITLRRWYYSLPYTTIVLSKPILQILLMYSNTVTTLSIIYQDLAVAEHGMKGVSNLEESINEHAGNRSHVMHPGHHSAHDAATLRWCRRWCWPYCRRWCRRWCWHNKCGFEAHVESTGRVNK